MPHLQDDVTNSAAGSLFPGLTFKEKNALILAALETIRVHRFIPYRKAIQNLNAPGSAPDNIDDIPVKPGWQLVITQISAVDATSSPALVKIGYVVNDTFFELTSASSPTAGVATEFSGQHILVQDEFVRVSFADATAADDLRVVISGYMLKR